MRRVLTKLWPKVVVTALGVALVAFAFAEFVDWRSVREWMQQLDVPLLLVLMALLPLFGFSISLVYLVIGSVFGGPVGLAVVAGISAVHLLCSHWIGQSFLRAPLQRWLDKRKHRLPDLPKDQDAAVALMMALVPGLPYFVRNYLLAVSGIPLRIYFWICWPVYVARSCLVLFLGGFSDDLTLNRVLLLGGVFVLKVSICAFILHRLRARWKRSADANKTNPTRTPLQKRLARIGWMD